MMFVVPMLFVMMRMLMITIGLNQVITLLCQAVVFLLVLFRILTALALLWILLCLPARGLSE